MASSGDELSNFKVLVREKHKKRRHSYSSGRLLATKTNSSKPQSTGSLSTPADFSDGDLSSSSGTLLSRFLRSKRRKKAAARIANSQTTSLTREGLFKGEIIDILAEQKGEFVRVVSTILNPKTQYKTLPITRTTTVFEVVVKLVGKYAQTEQNPRNFYLTEVRESDQGSYSRVLQNSDQVYNIQSRWGDGTKCSFVLCKKESLRDQDDPFLANPLRAMVMSPSQNESFTDTPGFTGVVDVDVPTTPTSPNSYSAKTSFFDDPELFSRQPIRNQLVISPSELSNDELYSMEILGRNEGRRNFVEPEEIADEFNISKMMQESVSEGMLEVMNNIVTTETQSPSNQQRSPLHGAPSPKRDKVQVRPLIYSPMQSAEKQYPEYVFTPKPAQAYLRKTEVTFGSIEDGLDECDNEDLPATVTRRISSPVKFESFLEIQPRYQSSASLYPSFLRNSMFRSVMDFGDTIYDVFGSSNKHSLEHYSPLLEQASPQKPKLKRHHTFHVRRDHLQLQLQDELPLLRDHLIHRAAQAIKQRRSVGALPDRNRVRRSSSINISRTSLGSETDTDLDALKELKIRNVLHSYSSERSLSCVPLKSMHHSRVDSDSLVDMKGRDLRLKRLTSDSVLIQPQRTRLISETETTTSGKSEEETSCSSEEADEQEVLYTFQSNLRPVTVVVQRHHEVETPPHSKNSPPLTTTEPQSEEPPTYKPKRITKKWLSEV